MGIGINGVFNTARKALQANLAAINVTGHNIANTNTEGYSRQRIDFQTSIPIAFPDGIYGTGVDVGGVHRFRNEMVARQMRRQNEDLGNFESLEGILKQLESIFNEPSESGGIRILLSRFFDDFQELANEPESSAIRMVVLESARVLTQAMNRIDDQITVLSNDLKREIDEKIRELNTQTDRVADLNVKIVTMKNVGEAPNDLLDQRDVSLNKISKLIDVYYRQTSVGAMNVSVGSRSIVAEAMAVAHFKAVVENVEGDLKVKITGEDDDIVLMPRRGELAALLEAKNEIIPRYRAKLDELASSLITTVNNFHRNGVGLKGNKAVIPHDNDFFAGTDAGSITISDDIAEDVKNIAAAERVQVTDSQGNVTITGEPGNNKNALEIARLKTTLLMESQTATFNDFLSGMIGSLGVETLDITDKLHNQRRIVTQLENVNDSISGVSLDEEMTNLIQFQRAYQASARTISTVDELFQTILGMGA